MRTNAIALVLLALTGCGAPCARNSDCASGYVCTVYGECVIPPSDGGVDGGTGTTTDAATTTADARTTDASTVDALIDAPSPVMNGVDEIDSKRDSEAMGAPHQR